MASLAMIRCKAILNAYWLASIIRVFEHRSLQLRQIRAAWQTLAPALRQLESPIHRRYVNIFQDYKLNLLNLKRIETIAANQYHHRNQPLDH